MYYRRRSEGPAIVTEVSSFEATKTKVVFVALISLLIVASIMELIFGPVSISLKDILDVFLGRGDVASTAIILDIRLPRTLIGISVGISLAVAGCSLQGVLRNPLADPGIIGVTGGAALGAVAVIVLGNTLLAGLPAVARPYVLPVAAFIGAATVTGFIFSVSNKYGRTSVATLILAGVAVNAIAGAAIGAMVYISDDQQLREIAFWQMGSLASANWVIVLVSMAIILSTSLFLLGIGKPLDLFQLGERAAYHSGLDIEKFKLRVALFVAISVGAGTAACGPIGFIGLVAPHIARLIIGPDHHRILPASALTGAILLLFADLCVRSIVPPAEPPVGLATSLIGGPFFLWLLMRNLRKAGYDA